MRALVLMSGGLDSTLAACMAAGEFGERNVKGVTFSYGQKHRKEVHAAEAIAERLDLAGIEHIRIPKSIFEGAGSTLIDKDKKNPERSYEDVRNLYGVSPSYVPFRNGIFISIAVAVAMRDKYNYIYLGVHSEDARNFAYPDCTSEFVGSIGAAVYIGTYHEVRVVAPLQNMTKVDIVRKSVEYNSPMELTWSCYNGHTKACGKCSTCVSRLEAFRRAGIPDPVIYEGSSK